MQNNSINNIDINLNIDKSLEIDIGSPITLSKKSKKNNITSPLPIKSLGQIGSTSEEAIRSSSGRFWLIF